MASGICVTDQVKCLVQNMRVNKSCDDSSQRMRIVTFTIENNQIDVEKIFTECDLHGEDAFKVLRRLLAEHECVYFLYDCHFETVEGHKKEELVFGSWVSENSGVKLRMKYASSRGSIKSIMDGTKHDLELHDPADFLNRAAFAELLKKTASSVTGIEGCSLCD